MLKLLITSVFILMANFKAAANNEQHWLLTSQHSKLAAEIRLTKQGSLQYRLKSQQLNSETVIINWSSLGLTTQSYDSKMMQLTPIIHDFSQRLRFTSLHESQHQESYPLLTGKRLKNTQQYTQFSLDFKNQNNDSLTVDFRLDNDGLAFRYRLTDINDTPHTLLSENTEFSMPMPGEHWGQAYDFTTKHHPSYETEYHVKPIGSPAPETQGTGWGFPSLFNTQNHWILVHEANLSKEFHGSHLAADASEGTYQLVFPDQTEVLGLYSNQAISTLPWDMPWRFIVASTNLADIVQSNRVFDLSAPSKVADISWIKPGKVSWSWWSDHASSKNEATLKRFIDLASEMEWPYSLVDANWNLIHKNILSDLVDYAQQKNVGLFFWYNSGGEHNIVTEQPRNRITEGKKRRAEFAKLQQAGVKGIKVDFVQSDKQHIIRLYHDILEDAAEFELLVNFHGSTIPRGWQRTWPNLMTMEAVRGGEFYTFGAGQGFAEYAPYQATILPFTRNVIGSMDFTPVTFSNAFGERVTSDSHEAALAVIYESGTQHFADSVESYRALPTHLKRFLKQVPTVWQDTRLLAGTPGKDVIIARRSNTHWYVAAINGENKQKSLSFEFPEGAGKQAQIIQDNGQGKFTPALEQKLTLNNPFTLQPFGGQVWIVPLTATPQE